MAANQPPKERRYRGYRLIPHVRPYYGMPWCWEVRRPDGSSVRGTVEPERLGFYTLDEAQRAVRRDLGIENDGDRRRWATHPALAGTAAVEPVAPTR